MSFKFVDVDSGKIVNDLIGYFEDYTGESVQTADAKRALLQAGAYIAVVLGNNINTTGNKNLLRYATGEALDEMGDFIGVARLNPDYATVTLQFTLSSAQAFDVVIPAGTRATADGELFFATDEDLTIQSGGTSGTVAATATVAGERGNGLLIGQIANIVDGVPYVGAVTNTTESTNGRDEENDEDYRERIRLAPFSYSTAGAEEAYRYLAMSANANVGDVYPYRESAGTVAIAVVKSDGTLPEAGGDVLTDVESACSAKTARPLTDNVIVKAATAVTDNINIEYYINTEDSANADSIHEAVKDAVAEYKLWQTTIIGRDINPDRLRKLVLNAGADKLTIIAPTAQTVRDGEVAQFASVNISYKGLTE